MQETCTLSTGPCYSVVTEQRASALVPMLQVLVVQWEEGRTAGSEQKFRCYSGCPISLCPNNIFTYGNTSRKELVNVEVHRFFSLTSDIFVEVLVENVSVYF